MTNLTWSWDDVEAPYRAKHPKPPRQPQMKAFSIRLPIEIYDQLKDQAIQSSRSMNGMIEHLLLKDLT